MMFVQLLDDLSIFNKYFKTTVNIFMKKNSNEKFDDDRIHEFKENNGWLNHNI